MQHMANGSHSMESACIETERNLNIDSKSEYKCTYDSGLIYVSNVKKSERRISLP